VADDDVVPAEFRGAIDLKLHGRERRHPRDLAVAHLH